jgi:VWFA-related protein
MTWRGLTLLIPCAAALAQLPRSQAPMPRDYSTDRQRSRPAGTNNVRLDATVTDLHGRPIQDLSAADFTLEADGKPQKIDSCVFRAKQPLRLAVLIDDLSLPLNHLNEARRALREFAANLGDGDQMAILRAGGGEGALDGFTSDKAALSAAIDRARYNPESESIAPENFGAGALGVASSILDGMRDSPDRKALLVISEGFRDSGRGGTSQWEDRLAQLAHRGSAVVYAVDMAATPNAARLDRGLAMAARDTGGQTFDDPAVAKALARIAQDQAGYYLLTYHVEEFPFDAAARQPHAGKVELRAGRPEVVLRARNGAMGPGDDVEGWDYADVEAGFERSINSELISNGVGARLTALMTMPAKTWQVEATVHVDARDLTFTKGVDGLYRTSLEAAASLFDTDGRAVKGEVRSASVQLTESLFQHSRTEGFDVSVVLPAPVAGAYQVRAAIRDAASGRTGSAREFVRVPDVKDGRMLMSSLIVHGELEKSANGTENVEDPGEAGSVRSFRPGRRITYTYNLYNVAADSGKRSEIETVTEIWRDGVKVSAGDPKPISFPASENPGRRAVSGTISLGESTAPGAYLLRISATDKGAPRTQTRWIDFEVRR